MLIGLVVVGVLIALLVWLLVRRDNPTHQGSERPREVSDGAPRTPPPGIDGFFRGSG